MSSTHPCMCGLQLEPSRPTKDHTLKKLVLPLSEAVTAPQEMVGIVPTCPFLAQIWPGLSLCGLCAHGHNHCEFTCAATFLCPEQQQPQKIIRVFS